jgi:hypothetical protein
LEIRRDGAIGDSQYREWSQSAAPAASRQNRRSMEEEVRDILRSAEIETSIGEQSRDLRP